jgi:hypothetical protein
MGAIETTATRATTRAAFPGGRTRAAATAARRRERTNGWPAIEIQRAMRRRGGRAGGIGGKRMPRDAPKVDSGSLGALFPHSAMCRLFEGGDEMPTNLALDDSLIEEAVKVGNHRTKKEAVTAALQEYVQARKRREILEWVGKVDYEDDYDPKRLRNRKPQ